ncbi:hypothetical protein McpSp1_09480 [Methanocorpusculaceae archaeon Sp1]|nr:hypothetical protein [Methanocorpusculaceae archaeon Sp1]
MKNTKIMTVFVVLLAVTLFVGAASAAATNEPISKADWNNNITIQVIGPDGTMTNVTTDTSTPAVLTVQKNDKITLNLNLTGNITSVPVKADNVTTVGFDWGTSNTRSGLSSETATYNGTAIQTAVNGAQPFEVGAVFYTAAGTYTITGFNGDDLSSAVNKRVVARVTVVDSVVPVDGTKNLDVFVFETIYNATATKLVKYSDGMNPSVVNQISGSNGYFYLTEAAVNGQYGTYVVLAGSTPAGNVTIWYPEISLQAELSVDGTTKGDSIDGNTINKDTPVSFLINSPKVAPAFANRGTAAQAKVVFTTPVGGKTTTFGTDSKNSLANVILTGTQTPTDAMTIGNDASAGTWTAQAEYINYKPFVDNNAKKSNTISFTVQSSTLTITAAKDSVVRSNPFTVTIQGESKTNYSVYLDGISVSDVNPTLQSGQSGFQSSYNSNGLDTQGYYKAVNGYINYADGSGSASMIGGIFNTDASGKRTVQFNTEDNTEDKTYTIKVSALKNDMFDTSNYDKVKVKVEKGAVTITASGDGSYYIGDEIKLTGTNTDSTDVFLFITGPNLAENGLSLKSIATKDVEAKENGQPVSVKTDNTWEYKWDTSQCALDTGAYTIYATSRLTNGKSSEKAAIVDPDVAEKYGDNGYAVKLSDSEYATVSVNLKQPFLSAIPSGTIVAKGDKIYIRGTAEGQPNNLKLYIFGPNLFEDHSITVEDDGSYEKKIDIGSSMSSNQYFVVIQHPMYNGKFDAVLTSDTTGKYFYIANVNSTATGNQASFYVTGNNKLQGSNAADALTKMIDSANIDDIYTKLTFTVAEPWIRIVNPGDQAVGSKFTIKGTTNLAIDDQILVEVVSSSFNAVDKTSTSTTSGVSQTTKVVAGDGVDNAWSVDIDTTNWKLDEYTIKVSGIEVDVTTTTNFNLVEKVVTPTPTATGAQPTTTTAPATTTATPSTPGFGAFIALAGLGAVALLVLRRN